MLNLRRNAAGRPQARSMHSLVVAAAHAGAASSLPLALIAIPAACAGNAHPARQLCKPFPAGSPAEAAPRPPLPPLRPAALPRAIQPMEDAMHPPRGGCAQQQRRRAAGGEGSRPAVLPAGAFLSSGSPLAASLHATCCPQLWQSCERPAGRHATPTTLTSPVARGPAASGARNSMRPVRISPSAAGVAPCMHGMGQSRPSVRPCVCVGALCRVAEWQRAAWQHMHSAERWPVTSGPVRLCMSDE